MSKCQLFLAFCILFGYCEGFGRSFYKGKYFYKSEKKENLFPANIGQENVDLWFDQNLTHFDPSETRTWKQRYFVNDTFFKKDGPIFLQIGGEGEANAIWMSNGAWINYAEKLNALCFQLEHRFYGKSHPTSDLSEANLRYLTSEQALADLASFTTAMKEKYNLTASNKWVAFGGSYPGALAAWYRMKYPHLVHMSVSSSAPLVAQLNFKEYLGVVTDSINQTNPQCLDAISKATSSIEQLLKHRVGWQMIQKTFKLCETFDGGNSKDVANLFEMLAGNFEDIVQYNEDNRGFEGSKTANISITTLCDLMTKDKDSSSPMERYAQVNELMLGISEQNCTDFKYAKSVKEMQNASWDSNVSSGQRQWTYQTCTEFGYFQSSDLPSQPFGHFFPINFALRQCRDFYGSKFTPQYLDQVIKATNTMYGGLDLEVTRVIFVNGNIDPWHYLGFTKQSQTTDQNLVIFINGTAHCANMYPESKNDPVQLTQARSQIFDKIKEWLGQK